ncbi:glycoside hydrolase family 38 C-terminal domain-containing protein [Lacticaseibacillus pantheris]|uniref:glycoside hydrolase family 38 N-terminal domain-containing protein n=1 Tax=Lacticaseibacillus pantheris TaxID=171523 RepID=UPI0026592960|nr:glycoside hydrolase family 38 C-terminal domain-containing protein [Lacticaseibacillus pantheris]WKF85882.1 glycoside hydrolase family 38 C-terminal domain-containing protein [Lacticaseibacillus pantheris]
MTNKTIRVSLVNHTHWDREWYFSDQDSLVLSDVLFKRALAQLLEHPEASFVLDGQSSVIEDFLDASPDQRKLVTQLSKRGQLKIGPWYTQPDALHIQGESLLRNGMIGTLISRKYGPRMEIGYLPDTFGFNAQVPVILIQLGLNRFLFWRGIDPKKTGGFYFNWSSLGGVSRVRAANMPQGYGTGMMMAPTKEYVQNRVDSGAQFIVSHTPGPDKPEHVLVPVGNDQMSIVQDMQEQVDQINRIGNNDYQMDTFENFFNSVNFDELPKYQGELVDPVFARVHRTCGSSRMDVKIAATTLESKLLHQVEPLMVIGSKLGINLGDGLLVEAWKKLLESQAHDSMAGSVVDSVNDDILHRLKQGAEIADGIINTIEKLLGLKLQLDSNQVLVINPLPKTIRRWFDVNLLAEKSSVIFQDVDGQYRLSSISHPARQDVLIETSAGTHTGTEPEYFELKYRVKTTLPGLGYKVLEFKTQGPTNDDLLEQKWESSVRLQSNGYTVQLDKGRLTINNEALVSPVEVKLIDDGNAGDTYDFSPMKDDTPIVFRMLKAKKLGRKISVNCEAELPVNLDARSKCLQKKKMKAEIQVEITEESGIKLGIHFVNNVSDHRLRLRIKSGIQTDYSIASVPFGFIKHADRKVNSNWADKYPEEPLDVHALDNNVTVQNDQQCLTVSSVNVKEYWAQKGMLDFTLIATTDQLGKPNLLVRPGRASGDTTKAGHPLIPTPKAEMFNEDFTFEFKLMIGNKFEHTTVDASQELADFSPLAYQRQSLNLFLHRLDNKLQDDLIDPEDIPSQQSFLNLSSSTTVSAVYPAMFRDKGIVIRLMNRGSKSQHIDLPEGMEVINALEEPVPFDGVIPPMDVISLFKNRL